MKIILFEVSFRDESDQGEIPDIPRGKVRGLTKDPFADLNGMVRDGARSYAKVMGWSVVITGEREDPDIKGQSFPSFSKRRSSDPDTSREAADHVCKTTMKPSQVDVYRALASLEEATQKKLESTVPNYSLSRIRTAVSELKEMGRVVDTGKRETLPSGRKAIVWKAV